jgi:hypothetical protein
MSRDDPKRPHGTPYGTTTGLDLIVRPDSCVQNAQELRSSYAEKRADDLSAYGSIEAFELASSVGGGS